jgi:hypothetical protein
MTTTGLSSGKPRPFRRSITRSRAAAIDLAFWRVPERLFDEPDALVRLGARRTGGGRADCGEAGADGATAKVEAAERNVLMKWLLTAVGCLLGCLSSAAAARLKLASI